MSKIFITGGTGFLGSNFVKLLYDQGHHFIIYSRDEQKQFRMALDYPDESRVSFVLGCIRSQTSVMDAVSHFKPDVVLHTAAQKHVKIGEHNPMQTVLTNIHGTKHIVRACIANNVRAAAFVSTDKAVNPINLYGSTKLFMEKIFINGNAYAGGQGSIFSCVRYGNVISSRGSVIQKWKELSKKGKEFPLTDRTMTRFWLTLDSAVNFVYNSFKIMNGGEIIIPKLRRMNILDLAEAIDKNYKVKIIGIRQGEKLHETLIGFEEILNTIEFEDHYIVYPNFSWLDSLKGKGKPVDTNFVYSSDKIIDTISVDEMRQMI